MNSARGAAGDMAHIQSRRKVKNGRIIADVPALKNSGFADIRVGQLSTIVAWTFPRILWRRVSDPSQVTKSEKLTVCGRGSKLPKKRRKSWFGEACFAQADSGSSLSGSIPRARIA